MEENQNPTSAPQNEGEEQQPKRRPRISESRTFDAPLDRNYGRSYQPRNSYQSRPQGGYDRQQGGYQEGGYQPRQGGFQSRQGGYGRPQQGGYGRPQQGGYQSRYNNYQSNASGSAEQSE